MPVAQAYCLPAVLACVGVDACQLLLAALHWTAWLLVDPCIVAGVATCALVPVKDDIGVVQRAEFDTLHTTAQRSMRHSEANHKQQLLDAPLPPGRCRVEQKVRHGEPSVRLAHILHLHWTVLAKCKMFRVHAGGRVSRLL